MTIRAKSALSTIELACTAIFIVIAALLCIDLFVVSWAFTICDSAARDAARAAANATPTGIVGNNYGCASCAPNPEPDPNDALSRAQAACEAHHAGGPFITQPQVLAATSPWTSGGLIWNDLLISPGVSGPPTPPGGAPYVTVTVSLNATLPVPITFGSTSIMGEAAKQWGSNTLAFTRSYSYPLLEGTFVATSLSNVGTTANSTSVSATSVSTNVASNATHASTSTVNSSHSTSTNAPSTSAASSAHSSHSSSTGTTASSAAPSTAASASSHASTASSNASTVGPTTTAAASTNSSNASTQNSTAAPTTSAASTSQSSVTSSQAPSTSASASSAGSTNASNSSINSTNGSTSNTISSVNNSTNGTTNQTNSTSDSVTSSGNSTSTITTSNGGCSGTNPG